MRHLARTAGHRLVLATWILGILALALPVRAFDLVVLLDESGSMRKTDPGNSRCTATEMFLRLCDERQRVALMGFSSSTRVLGDLAVMGPGAGRDSLTAGLRTIRSTDPWTDIEAGLRQALDELLRSGGTPDATRAVLLMTDGATDLAAGAPAVRDSVARIRGPLVSEYIQSGVRIYCVAYSKGADRQLLDYLAEATHGLCVAGTKQEELQKLFLRLFEEVAQPQTLPITGGKVLIDAAVSEATFLVNHAEGAAVRLTDPDGLARSQKDPLTSTTWFATPRYDLVTVAGPRAGTWTVTPPGDDAENRVLVLTDLKLEARDFAGQARPGQAVPLVALLTESGKPIENAEIASRIVMQGTLRATPLTTFLMKDDGAFPDPAPGDGLFGARLTAPRTPGAYDLEIVARAPTLERRLLLNLSVADAWFDIELDHTALAPGEVLALKVRLRDLELARKDTSIAFAARVRKPDGTEAAVAVDPATQYLYLAGFDDTAAEGDYRISVTGTMRGASGQPLAMTQGPRDFRVVAPVALALPTAATPEPTPTPTPSPTPISTPTPAPEPTPQAVAPPAHSTPSSHAKLYAWLAAAVVILAAAGVFAGWMKKRRRKATESEPQMQQLRERAVGIREGKFESPAAAAEEPTVAVAPPAPAPEPPAEAAEPSPPEPAPEPPAEPLAPPPPAPSPEPPAAASPGPAAEPAAPLSSPRTKEDDGVLVAVEGPDEEAEEPDGESGGTDADLLADIMNEATADDTRTKGPLASASEPDLDEADLLASILDQPSEPAKPAKKPPAPAPASAPTPAASDSTTDSDSALLAEILGEPMESEPATQTPAAPPAGGKPKSDTDLAIDDLLKNLGGSPKPE